MSMVKPAGISEAPEGSIGPGPVLLSTRLLQLLLLLVYVDISTGSGPGGPRIVVGVVGDLVLIALLASLLCQAKVEVAARGLQSVARRLDESWVAGGWRGSLAPRQVVLVAGCLVLLFGDSGLRLPLALAGWAVAVCWHLPESEGHSKEAWRTLWRVTFLVAVLARVGLVLGSPRPQFVPDSLTYVGYAEAYVFAGESFGFNAMRTPVTSLVYLAILWLTRSYYVALILMHGLGVLLPAYVALRLRPYWGQFGSWLLFCGVTISTRVIYYEHAVGTENLTVLTSLWASYQIVQWFAKRDQPLRRGLAIGAALALTVLTRPQFLVWVPFVCLALVLARCGWRLLSTALLAFLLPILLWCSYNHVLNGYFGLTSIGSDALFGCYGHLIESEGEDMGPVQREMAPALRRHAVIAPPWDPKLNWLIYAKEGPLRQSKTLQAMSAGERRKVVNALTSEAMRRKPLQVVRRFAYQVYCYYEWQYALVLPTGPGLERYNERYPGRELKPTESPLVHAIESLPGRAAVADAILSGTNLINRTSLVLVFQFPIWSLLFVVVAFRRQGSERLLLLVFASCSLTLVGLTCFLGVGWLDRYYIQLIVPHAFGVGVLARPWRHKARAQRATEQAERIPAR